MIERVSGDILASRADAIVIPVNTVGIMGAGLAKQFADQWPGIQAEYKEACKNGEIQLGQVYVIENWIEDAAKYFVMFPTKGHWREKSNLTHIEQGVADLATVVRHLRIRSIAVPMLGCGLGELKPDHVIPIIETGFSGYYPKTIEMFAPVGSGVTGSMAVSKTVGPGSTPGSRV